MNLLLITRKLDQNDDAASFVIGWVNEFSRQLSKGKLFIICQELGEIPSWGPTISVHSLGKEKGVGKLGQFFSFQKHLLCIIPKVDGVFAHMIQHYSIVAGPWCFLFKKPLYQWYMHKQVGFLLRLSAFFVDGFVTASLESFRLKTKKPVFVVGHGIDIGKFSPSRNLMRGDEASRRFLSVGRISPVKNIHMILEAASLLSSRNLSERISLEIIGGPGLPSQSWYLRKMQQFVLERQLQREIVFLGPLSNERIIPHYQHADVFINLSDTGSLDKVVLEAMACGTLVLTSNEAFKDILPPIFFIDEKDPERIATKMEGIVSMEKTKRQFFSKKFREFVVENHDLRHLIEKILFLYEGRIPQKS